MTRFPKKEFNFKEANVVRAFALFAPVLIALSLILLVARGSFPTPFSDEFDFYRIYSDAKSGNIRLSEILSPHNGHIYILLKLWLWLVVHYDIDWRASMYIQVVFVALTVAFISKYILESKNKKLLAILSVAFALGSARQAENLYWAIQISAAAMLFSSIVAFYFVARYSETQRNKFAVLAFVFSLVAFLSNGGGIATFLLTAFTIFATSKKIYIKTICALTGVLFVAGILAYVLPSSAASVGASLISIKSIFIYCLAFFSNSLFSFSQRGDDIYSLLTGAAVLALTIYTITSSWRQRSGNIFPYLLILFSVASCILISYARLKSGIWQPNASRYYPFAASILVGNALILSDTNNKVRQYSAVILFALIFISFSQAYFMEWKISPYRYIYSKNAHFSLCRGDNKGLAFDGNLQYTDTTILKDIFCTQQDIRLAEIKSLPVLKEIGPTQTDQNTPFNVQPDGGSALWARTENCENSCVIVFDGKEIPAVANQDGTLLTAKIPQELFESPGEKAVYVKKITSNKQSQTLTFKVH
jgi:hypothetical protein